MSLEQIELGNIIRKKRKSLGLTLNDLAGDNISVPTISNIERGVVHNVSQEKINYLLDKLGLDEQAIEQMKQSDAEERKAIEFELSVIRNLIETRVFDIARERILALEKQGVIHHHEGLSAQLQLAKGHLYRRQDQWDRAARAFRRVIQMSREAQLDSKMNLEAEAYCYLAQCALYHDEYEKALSHADKALSALNREGDKPYLEGRIYYDKSVFHYYLEAYAPAYECVQKAREVSLKAKDMRLVALSYNLEGNILKKQKMYSRATSLFKKAVDICTTHFPDRELASLLFLNMGDNYYNMKNYKEALRNFEVALDLVKATKDKGMLGLVYSSFAEVYFDQGEYEKAEHFVDQALPLIKNRNNTKTILEYLQFLLVKAKLELRKGEIDAFLSVCEEGIRLAQKSKKFDKQKEFHFILAEYYDTIGNKEKFIQETGNMYFVEKMRQGG